MLSIDLSFSFNKVERALLIIFSVRSIPKSLLSNIASSSSNVFSSIAAFPEITSEILLKRLLRVFVKPIFNLLNEWFENIFIFVPLYHFYCS